MIETYIDNTSFVTITDNNSTISPIKTNDENYVCYQLSRFSNNTYIINNIQDVSLNYALFGAGAPGDILEINSTYISGTSKTVGKPPTND